MTLQDIFNKFSEFEELMRQMTHLFQQIQRPAAEVILDDVDLRKLLKVSKRTTASWRDERMITYSKPVGKVFYKLSNILRFIDEYEIPAVTKDLKIRL